ncbi:hypothetical protein PTKIN_Ptkin11bG0075400 [Pterospermum kingtungense]
MAAKQTILIVAAVVLVLTLCSGTTAQMALAPSVATGPSAEAPTTDCLTNLLNLSDCLSYVTAGSKQKTPDKNCCPELAGLVESNPQCLCYLLDKNATSSYGINVDMKRALNLPNVCHVSTPPVSLCSVINGGPVGSPTASEGPTSSSGSAPQGLAASPSNGNGNGASDIAVLGVASLVAMAIAFLPTLFGI